MKIILLCLNVIKKNMIPIAVTGIMLTVSMFILLTAHGRYRYAAYAKDVYARSGLEDAVYFMLPIAGNPHIDNELAGEVRQGLAQFQGFGQILSYDSYVTDYNGYGANVFLYGDLMINSFRLNTLKGRWLETNAKETEAVIGGVIWDGVKVNDIVSLGNGISARVVGIMGNEVHYPSFSSGSNYFSANGLFDVSENIVFVSAGTLNDTAFNGVRFMTPANFFVVFKNGAGGNEKEEIKSYLETYGMVSDYDEIISNSNEKISEWVKGTFPLPLFMITIATINIICINAIVIKRSMNDHSKYYLLGCSRRKGIFIVILPLTAVFSIPALLNILNVLFFPNFFRAKSAAAMDYILNANSSIPVFLYLFAIILILTLMPLAFYRRYSPLDFYRRNT